MAGLVRTCLIACAGTVLVALPAGAALGNYTTSHMRRDLGRYAMPTQTASLTADSADDTPMSQALPSFDAPVRSAGFDDDAEFDDAVAGGSFDAVYFPGD